MGISQIPLYWSVDQDRGAQFPHYFSHYIEPLTQWIRQTESIKGICINGEDHKVALYGDYILIYLSTPSNSFSELMNLLETFGRYAGYKLNLQTQILTFNSTPPINIRDKFHFNWDQSSLKWKGIHLQKNISTLAVINYAPLLAKIKDDIHRWNSILELTLKK